MKQNKKTLNGTKQKHSIGYEKCNGWNIMLDMGNIIIKWTTDY